MKTTIDIQDSLLKEARQVASREGTRVRALVGEGLRRILTERTRGGVFRLRKATFNARGLQPQVAGTPWARIRHMAHEGRGACEVMAPEHHAPVLSRLATSGLRRRAPGTGWSHDCLGSS
jgi:hypothetical protein